VDGAAALQHRQHLGAGDVGDRRDRQVAGVERDLEVVFVPIVMMWVTAGCRRITPLGRPVVPPV